MGFKTSFSDFKVEQDDTHNAAPPTMAEVIKQAVEAGTGAMNVGMPAEIIKYDHKKQTVDVKPQYKRKYKDGKEQEMPVIYNVPLKFMRSGSSMISVPVAKGDHVWLSFSNRSLDKWKSNGATKAPEDTRQTHLSDAVAYPGGYPHGKAFPLANEKDVIIHHADEQGQNKLEIRLKKNGKIQIFNQGEELISILNDMLRVIRQAVVYTSTGAQKLRHHEFALTAKRLKTFLSTEK